MTLEIVTLIKYHYSLDSSENKEQQTSGVAQNIDIC